MIILQLGTGSKNSSCQACAWFWRCRIWLWIDVKGFNWIILTSTNLPTFVSRVVSNAYCKYLLLLHLSEQRGSEFVVLFYEHSLRIKFNSHKFLLLVKMEKSTNHGTNSFIYVSMKKPTSLKTFKQHVEVWNKRSTRCGYKMYTGIVIEWLRQSIRFQI